MEQIIPFLFGLLAIVPTIVLAMHGRQERTLHVHHYVHPASPQTPQESVQSRYSVLADDSGQYVLDTHSGATYAIVVPQYDRLAGGK
jgi:hypothetical protein